MTNLTDTLVTVNMGILGSIVKRVTHWVSYFSHIRLIFNIVESVIWSMCYWISPISDRRLFEKTQDFSRNCKNFDHEWGIRKVTIFLGCRISKCLRRAHRYDNFKLIISNSSESLAKPYVMAKLSWQNRTWHILKNRTKLLLFSLPVPPSWVLLAVIIRHHTIRCRSIFGPRGPGLSNPTSFLRPALPMAPTTTTTPATNEASSARTKRHSWEILCFIWRQITLLWKNGV